MSSIARHHAEWLSLLEISGPFLSMSVLMDVFPHGLETDDTTQTGELRAAYEEWADNQGGLRPDPAIHTAWVRYVLQTALDMDADVLVEGPALRPVLSLSKGLSKGQAIPDGIKAIIPEHGEVIRPDIIASPPVGGNEGGQPRLLIQIYPADQPLERSIPNRPWKASAATRMMELLRATGVRLGLVTNGERWMLVHAQRGETTTFVSWYAGLWLEERLTLRAFRTLLGARRFFGVPDGETLEAMLAASAQDQHEVTDQLGYQVRQAVEILIQAIDRADQDRGRTLLSGICVDRLYEAALTVMMRLVFLLTAEERGLLLLGDPIYDQHYAVSTLRAQLREMADQQGEEVLERRFDAWCRLLATFRAVHNGVQHENLRLPAHGGSLFDPDALPFLEGRLAEQALRFLSEQAPAAPLPINNRTVLHLLKALQMLQVQVPGSGPTEARRLSFRALDIEQIGHVYEGLLDHTAVRATEPVLGLVGTKYKEPEIPLSQLESRQAQGRAALVKFLREQTGRSAGALKKAAEVQLTESDALRAGRLRASCGNDEALYRRVLPFAGLVRDDDYGFPVVIFTGSVYVTEGPTRRATGTHYTPRILTEPIVQHTLEPLVYVGPAEGLPRDQWQLRSPAELLALKICDMAMGSGGFHVQVCRYLAERLVEAWERLENVMRKDVKREGDVTDPVLRLTPEGELTDDPNKAIPTDTDERVRLARRLVAERCIYGVDKNPLAVEMAKLSLWLLTLDKGRPFTFLDHALKCGDSLVGADEDMFLRWSHTVRGSAMPLFDEENRKALEAARAKRRELQSFEVRDAYDAERKAHLLAEAEAAMERIKQGCDVLVGARLLDNLSQAEQDALLEQALIDYTAGEPFTGENAQRAVDAARRHSAFHWPFEFPEVFAANGFGAFVGNPPFMSAQRITSTLGESYRNFLVQCIAKGKKGTADLCAYFFLRAVDKLSTSGYLGLIATNTISEGNTREVGLSQIIAKDCKIHRAVPSQKWPGVANLSVAQVWIAKSNWKGKSILEDNIVNGISAFLRPLSAVRGKPYRLSVNRGRAFQGSIPLGKGFILTPEEAMELVEKDSRNRDILFPFLNGQDLNSRFDQSPSRWVIYFHDWSLERAASYPDCFKIVETKVKPQRAKNKEKQRREIWWRFTRPTLELYRAISGDDRVLVCSEVTKHLSFALVEGDWIYSSNVDVFVPPSMAHLAILQSSLHDAWARMYCSHLETRLKYSTGNGYETFPHPYNTNNLASIGQTYHEHRRQLMLDRQEGLTKTYNRFHDPDEAVANIVRLRELHVEMDQAVAAAYGWDDLALDHGFHETPQGLRFTISQEARWDVLDRLLALNHERYAEEVAVGLHEKKKGKGGKRKKAAKKKDERQMELF